MELKRCIDCGTVLIPVSAGENSEAIFIHPHPIKKCKYGDLIKCVGIGATILDEGMYLDYEIVFGKPDYTIEEVFEECSRLQYDNAGLIKETTLLSNEKKDLLDREQKARLLLAMIIDVNIFKGLWRVIRQKFYHQDDNESLECQGNHPSTPGK